MDDVAFRGFVSSRREFSASFDSGLFVTSGDGGENFFAQGFDAAFSCAVTLGAHDGLTSAFDGRFVIGHNYFLKNWFPGDGRVNLRNPRGVSSSCLPQISSGQRFQRGEIEKIVVAGRNGR